MGTRFIASAECGASEAYKRKVIACGPEDIVYTDKVSGVHGNFIADTLPDPDSPSTGKRWKDIWSAGQGVVDVHEVLPIERIVDRLVREYHNTLKALGA